MAEIEITASTPAAAQAASRRRSAQTKINDRLGWALLTILALSPVPFGSNRPLPWIVTAAAIALVAIWYVISLSAAGEKLRFGLGKLTLPVILFCILCLYLFVQILPLGIWPPVLVNGAELTSDTISLTPGATGLMQLRMATYGLFFALMLQVGVNRGRARWLLSMIVYVITAHAVYGLVALVQFGDTILGLEKIAYSGVATGTFINRNSFATFLAFGAIAAIVRFSDNLYGAFAPDGEDRRQRLDLMFAVDFVCLVLIVAALLATQSRMGAFACLAGSLIAFLTLIRRGAGGFRLVVIVLPLLAIAAYVLVTTYGTGFLDRLGSVESSADVRGTLYEQVMAMIWQRPWLGYGGGSFATTFQPFHQLPLSTDVVWDRSHNTYLALWSELGIVFGSIPILIYIIAGVTLLASIIRSADDWAIKATALGVLVAGAVHSLVDFSLEMQAVTLMYIAFTALGLATTGNRKAVRSSQP